MSDTLAPSAIGIGVISAERFRLNHQAVLWAMLDRIKSRLGSDRIYQLIVEGHVNQALAEIKQLRQDNLPDEVVADLANIQHELNMSEWMAMSYHSNNPHGVLV